MATFRVHFETGGPVTVDAATPADARKRAEAIRPGRITKVKLLREKADG